MVVGFLISTAIFTRSCQVKAPVIQIVKSSSGAIHPAIPGRPVIVKAVLEPRPGRLLHYSWDFGDDTEPATGIVTINSEIQDPSIVRRYTEGEIPEESTKNSSPY